MSTAAERRKMVVTVLLVAVAVLAVAGAVEIAGSQFGTLAAAVGSAAVVRRWRRRQVVPPTETAASPAAPGPDLDVGARPAAPEGWRLEARPTAELVAAWRHSFPLLSTARNDPFLLGQISAQRRAYLDELARRDPDGFRRWIDSGARAAGDPSRYLSVVEWRTGPDEEELDDRAP